MYKLTQILAGFLSQWRRKNLLSMTPVRWLVFLHDALIIPLAWALAYWLRFNLGKVPAIFVHQAISALPIVIVVQSLFYWLFGLYRGVWRFASLPDLVRIIKVVVIGSGCSILILFLTAELMLIPRSIFPLYSLLLVVFLGGSRVLYRWLKDYVELKAYDWQIQRVLVVGAGQAGEGIVRDLMRQHHKEYQVVAFIDDASNKQGQEIHGIRVLGETSAIPRLVQEEKIDLIMIAMPSARSADMRRIVAYCDHAGVPFRTLPGIGDLASGNVQIDALRAVSLEDLLGRDPVVLDWQTIRLSISDKVVLVSGGGGSIGSELCRQIAQLAPRKLVVLEQNEFNLYTLTLELQQHYPQLDFSAQLMDITDSEGVSKLLQQQRVDSVFHAAAYKHVPMLETQLRTAVKNNILGTKILAEQAVKAGVKKFVLISTDKAVNPTNIMGASKRVAELFCQNYGLHSQTQFITVRFGNVLGSAGSVVPLFKQQIAAGGPITVTHAEISRFFMTIPEAAQLILQSFAMGQGGEIFVLDMGEPIKITYLAEQMIRLAGLMPGRDIEIRYTGLRAGEKLHEELFHEAEPLTRTGHEKILQASYRKMDWQALNTMLAQLETACQHSDEPLLHSYLRQLVPEYSGSIL